MTQRRANYRVKCPIEAHYLLVPEVKDRSPRVDPLALIAPDDPAWQEGMIDDISAGGVRLHGKAQIGVGYIVGLMFEPPGDFLDAFKSRKDEREWGPNGPRIRIVEVLPKPFPLLKIRAKVINVSLDAQSRTFVHSLQYYKIRPGDRDQIERFINLYQRYELRLRVEGVTSATEA